MERCFRWCNYFQCKIRMNIPLGTITLQFRLKFFSVTTNKVNMSLWPMHIKLQIMALFLTSFVLPAEQGFIACYFVIEL
jgi:hypothetical protein